MSSAEDQLVGSIIAERRLSARIGESELHEVVIRMAAPERVDDGYYRCYWEFAAPGYRKVHDAAGLDGFQAIHLTTKMIGVILWCMSKDNGYHFTWEGTDDLGFPKFTPQAESSPPS
jgi:hypothetical protein